MAILFIEGNNPLSGEVKVSGAKDSALKLISAAIFSNEDVVLENVPRIPVVEAQIQAVVAIGAKVEWSGRSRLIINASTVESYKIPQEFGKKYRVACLLVPPLMFRFGKAVLPKMVESDDELRPVNRLLETWQKFGVEVKEDHSSYYLNSDGLKPGEIGFRTNTHIGTDNAVLTALFISGESLVANAAEEPEVDDLINFCNQIGGQIERKDNRQLMITGNHVFGGGTYTVQGDKDEVVLLSVATLMTEGVVTIKGADKTNMLSFVNMLSKLGVSFEFAGEDELRVWHATEDFNPTNITTAKAPGFLTDWQYATTVLLTKVKGESLVHETIYTNNFDYIKDLNRMGAKIQLFKPSEVGLQPVISDDSYNYSALGEPYTVAKVKGPTRLKGTKMHLNNAKQGAALVIAGLAATGKSEYTGFEVVEAEFSNIYSKLNDLGARLSVQE